MIPGWQERPVKALHWRDGLTVQFGNRILTVNVSETTYRGFESFRQEIAAVLAAVPNDLVNNLIRTSLRYIKLIVGTEILDLDSTHIGLRVRDGDRKNKIECISAMGRNVRR